MKHAFVHTSVFDEDYPLPLVISPVDKNMDPISWAEANRRSIDDLLLKHGGILFRGFERMTAERLQEFIHRTFGETLEYNERSSPRTQVSGNIYTSTEYPPNKEISLHNENSYQKRFPARLFFFCEIPSETGGETPLADCRRVLSGIDAELVEEFKKRKWMLIRNFNRGFGLNWQTVFQTRDKQVVENYCRENDVSFIWEQGDVLQTRACREAIHYHPQTKEPVWFNHGVFFHLSSIEPGLKMALREVFEETEMPANTFWGDGEPIEDAVIAQIRQAYKDQTVSFKWEKNDLLILDNMLVAHGRATFSGNRRVLVGMSNLISS